MPPRRRTTPVGVVVTGADEPNEHFSQIAPIHHPFSEVQSLSQRRRREREEAAHRHNRNRADFLGLFNFRGLGWEPTELT
jgi:hypothetical protein